jgi:predicted DNA binding CopG/RHH family protein
MTKKYVLGPAIDLDREEVYEPDGTRLTEARAAEIAQQVLKSVRGRPSLSGEVHSHSPRVSVRLPEDELEVLRGLAKRKGLSVSTLAREAIEKYLKTA